MKVEIRKEVEVKQLRLQVGARYWEDASVNGVEDTQGTLMPMCLGDEWCPVINLDSDTIVGWPTGTVADIHYKCCDCFAWALYGVDGEEVISGDGYPNGSDYVVMRVDGEGKISGWSFDFEHHMDNL